jgi:hypothetical protein
MTRALVFLLVLLVAIIAFSQFLRRNGMFFPDRYPTGRWERNQFLVVPSEHSFSASDGVKLHA